MEYRISGWSIEKTGESTAELTLKVDLSQKELHDVLKWTAGRDLAVVLGRGDGMGRDFKWGYRFDGGEEE